MTIFLYGFDYADPELRQSYRPAHLHYLEQLAEAGKVLLAGPAPNDGGGLVLFDAARADVEDYIAADPYTTGGVAKNSTLREWQIVIGEVPGRTSVATENADAVRRYYSTVDAGSAEEVVRLFAPEAVYQRPGYAAFKGHQALLRFYRDDRVIRQGVHTVEKLVEDGADVVVEGSFTGVLMTGEEVNLRFADTFRLADQLIVERNTYFAAPLV